MVGTPGTIALLLELGEVVVVVVVVVGTGTATLDEVVENIDEELLLDGHV